MVNEYLSEMDYQLQLGLYNYTKNPTLTPDDIITYFQSFITTFSTYASSKGVATSINLRLNEYNITANQTNTNNLNLSGDFNETIYISLNSSINFQSSNSGSKVSGVFIHYYGINMYISNSNQNFLVLTQRDFYGNILKFISGATFANPTPVTDYNNGTYSATFSGNNIDITLPSGLEIFS